jgi:hypothetical protein
MVLKQGARPEEAPQTPAAEAVGNGAQVLRVGLAFDQLLESGLGKGEALADLGKHAKEYDPRIVGALADFMPTHQTSAPRAVDVQDLRTGMVLKEELRTVNGALLASKGQELTDVLATTLHNFIAKGALKGTVRVTVEVGEAWIANASAR